MDSDILEGLPATDDFAPDRASDSPIPAGVSSTPPAPPVDAASVEPEPQTVALPGADKIDPSLLGEKVIAGELNVKEDLPKSTPTPSGISTMSDGPRVDVSAATVARMMGIASTSDLRLLEGRVDLLTSKVSAILTKMDRCLSMFGSVPTASDIGRLEVQVAAIKSMMRELLDSVGAPVSSGKEQADRAAAQEQSRKLREGIKTNTES